MQMPCQECPGLGACLMPWVLTSRSLQQSCKLCRRLPSRSHSPIEAYSCNLHILGSVKDSPQITCMTIDDWHQAQHADLVLSLIIMRLQDGTLGQCQLKPTHPSNL